MANSCVRRSHTTTRNRHIGKVDVFGMKSRGRALIPGLRLLIERVTKARDASLSKPARYGHWSLLCFCSMRILQMLQDESYAQRDTPEPDDHPIASESLR